ncbi:MAG TPA: hypothetical protein VNN21_03065 [Dehalococcoidia bacterium]|nr:hypothetical protein [Dehalococcoidia bacterium]
MQHDIASRREICCLSAWDKLRLAAERIDPSEYPEVALALVALDVPVGQVKRFALAIAAVRGEDCHRHFMGEYADLVWDTLREQITEERRNAA